MLTLSNTHSFKNHATAAHQYCEHITETLPQEDQEERPRQRTSSGEIRWEEWKAPLHSGRYPINSNPDLFIMSVSVKILLYNLNNFIILYKTIIIQHYYATELILTCTGKEVQPPAKEHQGWREIYLQSGWKHWIAVELVVKPNLWSPRDVPYSTQSDIQLI